MKKIHDDAIHHQHRLDKIRDAAKNGEVYGHRHPSRKRDLKQRHLLRQTTTDTVTDAVTDVATDATDAATEIIEIDFDELLQTLELALIGAAEGLSTDKFGMCIGGLTNCINYAGQAFSYREIYDPAQVMKFTIALQDFSASINTITG